MGTSSPKRSYWGTPTRCHRLSDGLHTFPPSFSIRPCEMTELYSSNNYYGTSSQMCVRPFNTNNISTAETYFVRTGSKRKHRDSYGSLE